MLGRQKSSAPGIRYRFVHEEWWGKDFKAAPQTKTGSYRCMCENQGRLAVLEAQRAETSLALGARAGSTAVGHTTQETVVFSSTDRKGDSVAWRA